MAETARIVRERLARGIATGAGVGYAPVAPGTVGTAVAGLLALGLVQVGSVVLNLVAVLAATGLGVWAAGETARAMGDPDPGPVVIDEVAGFWLAILPLPPRSWIAWGVAFLLFRLLDIWKPWPLRRLEALPGGWGIMLDDLAAGLVTGAVLAGWAWLAGAGL